MQHLYTLCFRLFVAFLAAKFLTRFFHLEGLGPLLGFTLLFLGNIYCFDFLAYREHVGWRRRLTRRPKAASDPPSPTPEPPPEN